MTQCAKHTPHPSTGLTSTLVDVPERHTDKGARRTGVRFPDWLAATRWSTSKAPARAAFHLAFCTLLAFTGASCGQDARETAVARCESQHQERGDPLAILVGKDGVRELCTCAVQKVYAKLPDADAKVNDLSARVEQKLERRGVLGAMSDSSWMGARGREVTDVTDAYVGAWASCLEESIAKSGRGGGGAAKSEPD